MEELETDERFAHIHKDPRFRRVPKKERKVKIDSRFQSMFENKFKVKATVDKRGKPTATTTKENLKKFYELDEEEEGDGKDKTALNESESDQGGSDVVSPSSSSQEEGEGDSSSSEEEGESSSSDNEDDDAAEGIDDLVDPKAKLSHNWNDVDHDAPEAEGVSSRLAVCNMNWDRIRAKDLFVLLHSFLPTGGHIEAVTIYPSQFGLERMAEEEQVGPRELRERSENSENGENREGEEFDAETVRLYQLNRLKYYYAVVEFDSKETASSVYDECDGMEYETSAAKLDLRFIPNDMTFDQTPKDQCLRLPDSGTYKPAVFTTTALCQQKVELTWDETDIERLQATMKKFTNEDLEEDKLEGLIASSSDEDEEDDKLEGKVASSSVDDQDEEDGGDVGNFGSNNLGNDKKVRNKYRSLLQTLDNEEGSDDRKDSFMEITWAPSLKSSAKDLVKKKKKAEKHTPWEEYKEKKKEKKKQKRLEQKREKLEMKRRELGIKGDDAGFDDPFFNDEPEEDPVPSLNKQKKKKKKNKKKGKVEEETLTPEDIQEREKQKAALELLMKDDDGLNHFSLEKLLEKDAKKKKQGKKKKKVIDAAKGLEAADTFQMDLKDNRFEAVYNSRLYNIDPSAPEFKETKGMKALIDEKLKRRERGDLDVEKTLPDSLKRKSVNEGDNDNPFASAPQQSVSSLVRSVKAKTEQFQMMKKLKKRR